MKKSLLPVQFLVAMIKFSCFHLFLVVLTLGMSIAGSSYSQEALSRSVTFRIENQDFRAVLSQIEKGAKVKFSYDMAVIPRGKVTFAAQAEPLSSVLEKLLKPLRLTYTVSGRYIIISKSETEPDLESQNSFQVPWEPLVKTIKGTVTEPGGEPLPGVSVVLKGTHKGTVTDPTGKFALVLSDDELTSDAILVFSFVGFISKEIAIGNRTQIDTELAVDTKSLEEIVVVGYGTQRKKDLTGAVTRIDPKLNETNPNVNFVQALRGTLAGVNVTDTGRPGADGTIRIRGTASISANNNPLIVVDGIIYTGGLSDINSNDIESIDVLKDASSAAIYGSRATNGVILITTKKGTSSRPRLTYNGYFGKSYYANTPKLMSPERYLQMKEDAAVYLGRPMNLTPIEEENYKAGRTIDPWEAISQDAPMTNHELSVSGKAERVSYYVSGSYTNMKGRVYGDNFSRFSSRINLDVAINDWLNIGTNTGVTVKNYSGIPAAWVSASYLSPFSSFYHEDGVLRYLPMDDGLAPNPLLASVLDDNKNLSSTLFSNVYADVALPVPGLSYRANIGNNIRFNENANFTPEYIRDGINRRASGSQSTSKHHYFTMENIVKYNKQFLQDHHFDLTLLYSFETTRNNTASLSNNNIFSDALSYHALAIGENPVVGTSANEAKANSVMGRIGYRLLDRYMFNFTVRRDGYSAFGAGRKYGNFPSFGLGWVVSEEKFMQPVHWISSLKFRYSWGRNGNRGIDPYRSLSNMAHSGNQYVFGDNGTTSVGIVPTSMANPLLGWETTVASNFGLDFGLFKDLISGSIEYYSMSTSDLLLNMRIPNMTGYDNFFTNIGGTGNKGFELTLNSVNLSRGDFSWETNLVFSLNRNKITRLSGADLDGDGKEDDDIASRWFIGHPIGTNFDYVWDGIWQEGEDSSIDPSAKPGFIRFRDVDGDGRITPADRQIIHSNQPDFLSGLTNRINYRGFMFSFMLNAKVGGYSPNGFLNHGTNFYDRTNLMDLPYWTPDNPRNDRPSIGYPNPLGWGFYQSRTFVRLQDVSLAYSFPQKYLKAVKIDNAKIYLSGKNLHNWTKWQGWDPEHGSGGRGSANGPLLRSYTLGINLTL